MSEMNIYQRVNEVRKLIDYVKKEKEVKGFGYMAVTHDAVTEKIRDHFITHGIVTTIDLVPGASKMLNTGSFTAKQVAFMRYEATYTVAFINMDNPDDRIEMRIEAHAIDHGDKAPGKAMSYAMKYAILKLFNLVTGEENEEERQNAVGGMTDQVLADWRAKIDEIKTSAEAEVIWKDIKGACEKAGNDMQAATQLRAHLSAKLTALKKIAPNSSVAAPKKELVHA